ncbi:ABC transporter ATP-binding protein [Sulfitobacter sp. S190]|uniref:ABC transporter ATP-binding protein n=1 Tax=Sulfitobacter sp. S190 TaxID=2867022 RepID=UPI0021A32906|nr:ABC transporter ATP-binding protein [Sulfitobacter sp. S190]UWR24480.1 ABC transporter ATP-binding protein [Sulfitobacter sp. S190]UWR24499.1 ABC transporter ATP-binding protein [Sulfitobacter sp. S190]
MTPYLDIRNLNVSLARGPRILRDVTMQVHAGQVVGLVGESGAGKSMIGKSVLGTLPRALRIDSGQIILEGTDLLTLPPAERRRRIGARAALIPQDPLTALNPVRRVGPQITHRLVHILGWNRRRAFDRALELLEEVHIPDPTRVMQSYPHELSGGMRQRILIASAFAAEPNLIVADEPTTALDVTVQKQILTLIRQMQRTHGTALVFVTHDLGVVSKVCDRLSVLYAGKIVENAPMRRFFERPIHSYARALLAATPTYTDPDSSLTPVSAEVIAAADAEIAQHDARHG